MSAPAFEALRNATAIPLSRVPSLEPEELRRSLLAAVASGRRIASLFGATAGERGPVEIYAVLADDSGGRLEAARTVLSGDRYASLTRDCPQAHAFEREIAEQFGIDPEGHPWLKPLRFERSWRLGKDAWGRSEEAPLTPGDISYYRVEGEDVHEVAVGPIHAGVIEPGHFRFQCHGERVYHLEISLGYQHRGIERALVGGPDRRTLPWMETAAGDTSVGHALAYCQAVEALSGETPTARSQAIRGIALELERLANHTGDLGALSGDVGYQPTAALCGRLRGEFLNMTAALCGSRFGRGLVRPGGAGFDIGEEAARSVRQRLAVAVSETSRAVSLLWDTPGVAARFEGTGTVSGAAAIEMGWVGPAARACGIGRDVRHDHPSGIYQYAHLPVMTAEEGDVYARTFVRWREIQQSSQFVADQIPSLPRPTAARRSPGPLAPESLAVSLVEGWRGEICHVAVTDARGRFARYKITDPSFHNWSALALALRGGQISDFPLCNKSFNLSYCGHDL